MDTLQDLLARAPGPLSGVLPAALERLDAATLLRLEQDLGSLVAILAADPSAAQSPLAEL